MTFTCDQAMRETIATLLERNGYSVEQFGEPYSAVVRKTVHDDGADRLAQLYQSLDRAFSNKTESAVLYISARPRLPGDVVDGLGRAAAFGPGILHEIEELLTTEPRAHGTDGECVRAMTNTGNFIVALSGARAIESASALATRLQTRFELPLIILDSEANFDACIGVANAAAGQPVKSNILIERAEIASRCVASKAQPAPQYYHDSMARWTAERRDLERDLRAALQNNEFVVYYQPRVATGDRAIVGMEALVRWNSPTRGFVPPAHFIPLAEETGLIIKLGEIVLREACRQCKEWIDGGLPPMRMGVNVAATQFKNSKFYDAVLSVLAETNLPPACLELELTESILMEDPNRTARMFEKFKSAGIHLSIDDFGTGYSSLSYLKRFPVDGIKIDQSFIRNVINDPHDAAIVTAVVVLGHSLGLTVIAEGVETESQLRFLEVLKCNEIQGYYFGKPASAADTARLLRRGRCFPKN